MKVMTEHERTILRKQLGRELRELLLGMEVPPFRREQLNPQNLEWMRRNLAINNGDHPKLEEAMSLVKKLINLGKNPVS